MARRCFGPSRPVFLAFALTIALGAGVALGVGRDFFPNVDAGQIRLHITARPAPALNN